MISKERAEEIARRLVLTHPGLVKATIPRTRFFEPEEYIRTHRFILDPNGVVDREAVGPAHWTVVFEVITKGDAFFRRFPVTDEAGRRNLFLKFTKVVDVDPETGEADFSPTFARIRVCDRSEI